MPKEAVKLCCVPRGWKSHRYFSTVLDGCDNAKKKKKKPTKTESIPNWQQHRQPQTQGVTFGNELAIW